MIYLSTFIQKTNCLFKRNFINKSCVSLWVLLSWFLGEAIYERVIYFKTCWEATLWGPGGSHPFKGASVWKSLGNACGDGTAEIERECHWVPHMLLVFRQKQAHQNEVENCLLTLESFYHLLLTKLNIVSSGKGEIFQDPS